jgi:hypothetical protein
MRENTRLVVLSLWTETEHRGSKVPRRIPSGAARPECRASSEAQAPEITEVTSGKSVAESPHVKGRPGGDSCRRVSRWGRR